MQDRVPPSLKWLITRRARLASALERNEREAVSVKLRESLIDAETEQLRGDQLGCDYALLQACSLRFTDVDAVPAEANLNVERATDDTKAVIDQAVRRIIGRPPSATHGASGCRTAEHRCSADA